MKKTHKPPFVSWPNFLYQIPLHFFSSLCIETQKIFIYCLISVLSLPLKIILLHQVLASCTTLKMLLWRSPMTSMLTFMLTSSQWLLDASAILDILDETLLSWLRGYCVTLMSSYSIHCSFSASLAGFQTLNVGGQWTQFLALFCSLYSLPWWSHLASTLDIIFVVTALTYFSSLDFSPELQSYTSKPHLHIQ